MKDDLRKLRQDIDKLDSELLEILEKRMEVVRKVGELKKANNLSIFDEKRKKELLNSVVTKGKSLKLAGGFVEKLYNLIHDHALELEKKA